MQYFISYSRLDYDIAVNVKKNVEGMGHTIWMDEERIKGGKLWREELKHAIIDSAGIILLLSPSSDKSDEVYKEIKIAKDNNITIYPLKTEDFKLSERVEFMNDRQWIKLYLGFASELEKFVTDTLPPSNDIIQNISQMAKEHFRSMQYNVRYLNDTDEITNMILGGIKKEKIFVANNGKIEFIVVPKAVENITSIGQLNFIESNLFWDARFLIWTEELQEQIKRESDISDADFASGNIDDIKKYYILKKTKYIDFRKNDKWAKNLLLYLYIKETPAYEKIEYPVRLLPEKNYLNMKEGEGLPHLYLNFSKNAGWFGAKNKALESINAKTYPDFENIYKELIPRLSVKFSLESQSEYVNKHKTRLAEALFKSFFESCSYQVKSINIEMSIKNNKKISDDSISHEDLVFRVNKLNQTKKKQYIKVKYNECKSENDIKKSFKEGGIYKESKSNLDIYPELILFAFIYNKELNNVEIYSGYANNLMEGKSIHVLDKSIHLSKIEVRTISALAQQCFGSCREL